MEIEDLERRLELLQAEQHKASSNVVTLAQELEKSRAHLQTITGHINEATFYLNEKQKEEPPVKKTNGKKEPKYAAQEGTQ